MHHADSPARLATVAIALVALIPLAAPRASSAPAAPRLRAGAAAIDVSPQKLPALCNGGFTARTCDKVLDPLHARALALADGKSELAIVVVDSCVVPRDICDRAKALATARTGLPADRILISATHAHSAPSLMDHCLGTGRDEAYAEFLPPKIAEAIAGARAALRPAQAAWAVTQATDHTFCRRWALKPGVVLEDPFGALTVRANMNPGYANPNFTGPTGPRDADVSLVAFREPGGAPIALLANFGNHYFGVSGGFSADYFGRFASMMAERLAAPGLVAMMSQGTSGDCNRFDFTRPPRKVTLEEYTSQIVDLVMVAYRDMRFRDDVDLAMAQSKLALARRVPDERRIAWARDVLAKKGDRPVKERSEVYAEQALWLKEHPSEELVLQAIRIGELGIAAWPNEVYAVSGLRMKARSPLRPMFNITLANGEEGYIPPPEHFPLGGYTTWPARTAGLEEQAEPKIAEALLTLLEQVSGKPRHPLDRDPCTPEMRERMQAALR